MFIHLTTHSAYSFQESLLSPSDLVQAAHEQNMPALGLADHFMLTGTVEFVRACKEAGIQPILGAEIDLEHGRLVLYAQSFEGWANLCRLVSALALREVPHAPCSADFLEPFSKDLIALRVPQSEETAFQLKQIFSDRLYLVLQDPAAGLPTKNLGRRLGLPVVVTQPVYCLHPQQTNLLRTLSSIRTNTPISQLTDEKTTDKNVHFASESEMLARFADFRSGLEKTLEIAERCQFDMPLDKPNMPKIDMPEGMTPAQVLRDKAEAGARQRYGQISPEIRRRLDHELEIIARLGYEPIFLIVEDVLNYARETNVPYSSRGSAASSLVAHCLGITSPDPLRLNLYFERFLNPARVTPPDIDTDLCSRRRDTVIQHVFDKYGVDRVAMVATINRYRPRSALGDVAKAYGLSPTEVRELAANLPYSYWARRFGSEDPESPFSELRKSYSARC